MVNGQVQTKACLREVSTYTSTNYKKGKHKKYQKVPDEKELLKKVFIQDANIFQP